MFEWYDGRVYKLREVIDFVHNMFSKEVLFNFDDCAHFASSSTPPPCFMSLVVWGNRFPALKCLLTKAVIEMAAFALLSDRHLPHSCIDSSWWFGRNNWLQVLSRIFPAGCSSENLGNLNYPVSDTIFPEYCNPLYCAGMPFTCQPQFFWVMKSLLDDKEISSGARKMAWK